MCSLPEAWAMLPEDILDAVDNLDRTADIEAHAKAHLIRPER